MPSWVYGADRFDAHDKPREELQIAPTLELHEEVEPELDPITYEVLRHRIWQINDEQFVTISRVSGSSIATEINDFNVAITDEIGDIVTIGSGIVWHCNGDQCVKWILENRSENPGIAEGDLFLSNDPWIHSNHQNDVSVLQPIFYDGKLFCWTLATVHQVDVGGINPGSFCFNAPDSFSEGFFFSAIKIVEGGELRRDMEDLFLRERLSELPDGVWRSEEYQEQSGAGDRGLYAVRLALEKKVDFNNIEITE